MGNIILPTEIQPAIRKLPRILYLYSQPKCGKTEALSKLENCLIIETDPGGADFVSCLKVQVNNIQELTEVFMEILKAKKPYRYVALDTTTELESWCVEDATKDYKNSVIGKNFKGDNVLTLPEGAGYQWLRTSFQKYMAKLVQCADHIICTGHIKDKFLGKKDNSDVSALDIDHTGQIKRMICAGADAIGYMYRTTSIDNPDKLWVSFKTKETVNCGSRCQHLAGQSFQFEWAKIYPTDL